MHHWLTGMDAPVVIGNPLGDICFRGKFIPQLLLDRAGINADIVESNKKYVKSFNVLI